VKIALLSILVTILVATPAAKAQNDVADIVLVNARVFTAVDDHPRAEAIAIKGNRIPVDGAQCGTSVAGTAWFFAALAA